MKLTKATIAKITKAKAAITKITGKPVRVKSCDGMVHLCIGWTDNATGDAAYDAAQAAMGTFVFELCADISGAGVEGLAV